MIRSKHAIPSLLLWICSITALAQPYGNEWINFNQSYFRIPIAENGIYQITRTELSAAGVPVGSLDPRKLQIFHQGQEIAIYVSGENDGVLNSNDFVAFYAEKNDGTTDTPLYVAPDAQPHTYYNLYSDSSAYFLTYRLDLNFGKRMTSFSENNIDGLTAENYYVAELLEVYGSNYFEGISYGFSNKTLRGSYDYYEGWTGPFVSTNQTTSRTLTGLTNTVQSDYTPNIELQLTAGNNNSHSVEIYVGSSASSLRLIETAVFNHDENFTIQEDLQWTDISSTGELMVQAIPRGVNGNSDRVSIAYIKVQYSKAFNLGGSSDHYLNLKTSTGEKSYISLQNTPSNNLLYDITDTATPTRIGINEFVSEFNAIVDNTNTSRTLYTQSGYKSISEIKTVNFQQITPSSYNYLIVSHPDLRANTSDNAGDQVEAYANYRSSTAGGGHTVLTIDIDQVYNQFNYGNPSPLGIKRFCQYMYDNGSPEFLFLIGKSTSITSKYYRQNPNTTTIKHFVPTFGYPGGDDEFSSGFDGGTGYSTLATGRINATEPDHIRDYLNKVIEKDATPFNTLRLKNLVHLSGGNSEQELNTFKNYIDGFASQAADVILGGESSQISKNSNTSVELINISDEVNDGVSMITFFGHSSGTITDIEIGLVSDPSFGYANKGKYPTMLVNGCLAGDFLGQSESFGVDWILTPDLGATAFIAHSYNAFPSDLKRFTELFYTYAFNDETTNSLGVGQIKQAAAKAFISQYGNSNSNIAQVQLENLQGDPAVKVFGADKADYSVSEDLIEISSFNNEQLIATVDSFKMDINIKNFGIYDNTPMAIQVVRTLADGSTITYGPLVFDPVLREEVISFVIDNQITNASGQNSLRVVVDPFNAVAELDETNNSATVDLFLTNGSTLNLLPSDYSIQSEANTHFFFQSSNLFSTARSYDFQIDTVKTFNSPYLNSQSLNAKVIAQLNFDLNSKGVIPDKTVFYWRTRYTDPLPDENDEWVVSSFSYDASSTQEGWAQHSHDQLEESNSTGLTLDTSNGIWDFITTSLDLDVQTYGSNHPTETYSDTKVLLSERNYFVSNSTLTNGHCQNNTINFLAFQRQSSAPFSPYTFTTPAELNPLICGLLPQYIFNFNAGNFSSGSITPIDYLNELSTGDKVLIFSLGDFDYSIWTDEFKTALEAFGIQRATMDNLVMGDPFIFLGSKNTGTPATEVVASSTPTNETTLFLNEDVIGSYDSGEISTNKIGPARTWQNASLQVAPSSNPSDDITQVNIIGIDAIGNEVRLGGNQTDMTYDLSFIDASTYPYIRLSLALSDPVMFSPAQLQAWQVNYESVPEGVLLTHNPINQEIELQEGQEQTSSYTFWNISSKNYIDSLLVNYKFLNSTLNRAFEDTIRIAALNTGDSVQFDIPLKTLDNTGTSDLVLEVNKADQYEQYTTNNSLRIAEFMAVSGDEYNPILNVLFDGIKIMDGDIVSPTARINITMTDENEYLLKEDTLGMNFYLKQPCEDCDYVRIPFSNPQVTWQAASEDTDFSIDYSPNTLEDGMHSLRVQVTDASGNESGVAPYEINFEVINESSITNFYPYPNPFSTQTRFVFTLTGSKIPEDLKIQIMTVSGRIVREIFMDELGSIRIGNNLSEYAWDGRDNYGDQLANGVYLYRVMIKNPGEEFKHRDTAGDKGFKNGFGKMYILR
ncbi:C25 family cysteine peptidase [Reichenbachiella agariperforans]|uniref:putative type IX secretion system sortase PorU2 n=1 Tax=Reichenbachiella agariperforans TaxID=156994 RepID=UPI001C08BF4F|nr:C25 family cysteine peptidase [Reichenbachiella agariperforans]MBU2913193.1 hypothetical protein [Reichenbachiella agariperforans]